MKDMFGNEITPGCMVVYPSRHGSNTYMRFGKVTVVDDGDFTPGTPRYTWNRPPTIKVLRCGLRWDWRRPRGGYVMKKSVVRVVCLDRVVVVPDSQFNDEIRIILA